MICLLIGKTVSSVVKTLVETLENSGRGACVLLFFFLPFVFSFLVSFDRFTSLFISTLLYCVRFIPILLLFLSLFLYNSLPPSVSVLLSLPCFSLFLFILLPPSVTILHLLAADDSTSVGQALSILCQDFQTQVAHRKYFYRSGKLVIIFSLSNHILSHLIICYTTLPHLNTSYIVL